MNLVVVRSCFRICKRKRSLSVETNQSSFWPLETDDVRGENMKISKKIASCSVLAYKASPQHNTLALKFPQLNNTIHSD